LLHLIIAIFISITLLLLANGVALLLLQKSKWRLSVTVAFALEERI
jgi:hypothetical protein